MPSNNDFINTFFTSLGIALSLLIAMLSIEFLVVGNLKHVLAYAGISMVIACIYFIATSIKNSHHKKN